MKTFKPEFLIWHTAAHEKDGVALDTTPEQITAWHKANGWGGPGYHTLIRFSGREAHLLRPLERPGIHARGLNARSLGLCFSGHGDLRPLTRNQMVAGLAITEMWMKRFEIPIIRVIGHREKDPYVSAKWKDHGRKTCPGLLVDMDAVRSELYRRAGPWPNIYLLDEQ